MVLATLLDSSSKPQEHARDIHNAFLTAPKRLFAVVDAALNVLALPSTARSAQSISASHHGADTKSIDFEEPTDSN